MWECLYVNDWLQWYGLCIGLRAVIIAQAEGRGP